MANPNKAREATRRKVRGKRVAVRKALRTGPEAAQTGPAVRHDTGTVKSHIELLSFSPQYQKLYRLVSRMIAGHYRKREK